MTRTGAAVTVQDDVAEFAALLRQLKGRTDRSYGSLARRLDMNTSTLHRYCAGEAVPVDFAPVERLAVFCGASPGERLELHRRWLAAVTARQRGRTAEASEAAESREGTADRETEPRPAEHPPSSVESHADASAAAAPSAEAPSSAVTAPSSEAAPSAGAAFPAQAAPPQGASALRRPRLRRRRLMVSTAVACALLATLGGLSALSNDRSPSAGAAHSSGGPRTTPSPTTAHNSPSPHAGSPSPAPGRTSTSSETPGRSPTASASAPGSGSGSAPGAAVPLAWSADSQVWALECGHDYVIDRPPAQVPPPPAAQDAGTWAAAQGAVHGRETNVRISVQGRSATAVVLEALRVRVVGRAAPAPGTDYAMDQGCGGSISPRYFAVDLDKDRPVAHSVPGDDMGAPIPAVKLPYRVSAQDPEVLLVTARTETCDCRWYLELDWSSQGRTGTVRIDDHGRPFRTSGIGGLPRYMYDTSGREWTPYR
ncbi:helix-turn-helix domain-containing protein [Streptomyces sp. NPDC059582]|uniref:helix-turn-helix domain-containing protein n=1 Tax=Streptomyces sp. NPDC059582 TaxID=3346875 RepID=UPI00369F230F